MEIRVHNLRFVYSKGTPLEVCALEDISFAVDPGRIVGILGGTGSGKTTLMRILGGFLTPTEGTVLIDGRNTREMGPGLKRNIGVVFQMPERQLFEETVYRDISFVMRRFSELPDSEIRTRVRAACDSLRLDIDRIGDRSPSTLSDADKRKVAIAAMLVNEPETLILDEPAVGLDPPSVTDLVQVLRRVHASGERTVIIVSHDMEFFLPIIDLVLVLDSGRAVTFGRPQEVWERLGEDPNLRDLLPGPALLVHELRRAGLAVSWDDLSAASLADRLTDLYRLAGVRG
jgi:energy-coupling factor transport system ATP-binding protein